MNKFGYYTLLAFACFLTFNSCSNHYTGGKSDPVHVSAKKSPSSYGAYLAGRIAHSRKDFDAAAEYYMKTAQQDKKNKTLLNRTYIMLASQGRISEAAAFAETAQAEKDNNDFIPIILMAEKIKQKDYSAALNASKTSDSVLYKKLINPLVNAWIYTGLNQYDKAISALSPLKKERGLLSLYYFHAGLINDYFDKPEQTKHYYENIINNEKMELSVRTLEIISNFYLRNGEKDKAVELTSKYAGIAPSVDMLQKVYETVQKADAAQTSPIITSPQAGASEAFFSIAAIVKHNPDALDHSHLFVRLSIYENPQNDLARLLLANIFETREMYKEANDVYNEISNTSPAYYMAQYKKSENLRNMSDYKGSELLLKSLIEDYPNDYQTLLDLGDTMRLQDKFKDSVKYYRKALNKFPEQVGGMWQLYYAMGISFERMNEWTSSELCMLKALELSPNNVLAQNYLGYSWLKQGKNIEEAFSMVASAYNQAPYNSSITDSLGWAFYQLGMFDQAIVYLEKAAESAPSSAVINDHLGDAYWQGGRKNEARFQWNHALILKDDSGEVSKEEIKNKLQNGLPALTPTQYDKTKIQEIIKQIAPENTEMAEK